VFDAEKYINQVLDGGVFKISSLDALPSDYPYREHLDGLGVQSFLSVPLIWSGKPVGILSSYSTSSREYSESDINLFKTIAAQMALTIKNAQYLDEVEQGRIDMERLSKVMISAQEEERRRIARELHDEAGQSLYALRLGLEVLRNMTGDSHAGAAALAGEQLKNVTQTIENIRRITYDLRPTLLDDLGLIPAVRWYADGFEKRSGIKVQLDMSMPADRMDPAFEVNIYRIVQEALNNAHKHAGASAINIRLRETDGVVRMEVSDNGRGFTARETGEGKGVGLLGMRERVSLMGGTLFVYSIKDLGTTISVEARAKPRS
jgi:signal transduction histidine kinase